MLPVKSGTFKIIFTEGSKIYGEIIVNLLFLIIIITLTTHYFGSLFSVHPTTRYLVSYLSATLFKHCSLTHYEASWLSLKQCILRCSYPTSRNCNTSLDPQSSLEFSSKIEDEVIYKR